MKDLSNTLTHKTTKSDVKFIKDGLKNYAKMEKRFNLRRVQSKRAVQDAWIGSIVGATMINFENNGWDGWFPNGYPFENKNKSITTPINLGMKDTSDDKVQILKQGVLCTSTFWENSGTPAYVLVGNSKNIGDLIEKKMNIKNRRSFNITFKECLDHGFKIAAVEYSKADTLASINEKYKSLGSSLTVNDILSKKELKEFTQAIAEG